MFDRMEAVFVQAPPEEQDPEALADIHARRDEHAPYCPNKRGAL
ncbi:hypothetical protein [Kitasatospora sp. NPDC093806]